MITLLDLRPKKCQNPYSKDVHNAEVVPGKQVRIWGRVRAGRKWTGRYSAWVHTHSDPSIPVRSQSSAFREALNNLTPGQLHDLGSMLTRFWQFHSQSTRDWTPRWVMEDWIKENLGLEDVAFWSVFLHAKEIHEDDFQDYDRLFLLGDHALSTELNLKSHGPITQIGAKTVTISEGPPFQPRARRYDFYRFAVRNWDYSRAEVDAYNTEQGMYL